jgi:hypothetical protein
MAYSACYVGEPLTCILLACKFMILHTKAPQARV